jgi:hypothetical protein
MTPSCQKGLPKMMRPWSAQPQRSRRVFSPGRLLPAGQTRPRPHRPRPPRAPVVVDRYHGSVIVVPVVFGPLRLATLAVPEPAPAPGPAARERLRPSGPPAHCSRSLPARPSRAATVWPPSPASAPAPAPTAHPPRDARRPTAYSGIARPAWVAGYVATRARRSGHDAPAALV